MIDSFRGWLRTPGSDWQPVASGSTEDDCWQRLRQHIASLGLRFVDSFVGPADSDPRRRGPRQAIRTPGQRRFF